MADMQLVFAGEELPATGWMERSLYLLPSIGGPGWRRMVTQLEGHGFSGYVFIPESRPGMPEQYLTVEWQNRFLASADMIVARIEEPCGENTAVMAQLGEWLDSGRLLLLTSDSDEVRDEYVVKRARQLKVPVFEREEQLLERLIEPGAERRGGERTVPLLIWKTRAFQDWYKAQVLVGNELRHAEVRWVHRSGKDRTFVFAWTLHVEVYVRSEDRVKSNEFIIARPDISVVVLHGPLQADPLRTQLVVVREFRSPVANDSGFVWEPPGGSAPGNQPSYLVAGQEVREETALEDFDADRLTPRGSYQLLSTFAVQKAHLFSAEVTDAELEFWRRREGVASGEPGSSERCYVEIVTVGDMLTTDSVDLSMRGAIFQALFGPDPDPS